MVINNIAQNIQGIPMSNMQLDLGPQVEGLVIRLIVRRESHISNNSVLGDIIPNDNEIYRGRTAKPGIYNILGFYSLSYINGNQFQRLQYSLMTSQGQQTMHLPTPQENGGNGVTVQCTVNEQQYEQLNNAMKELNANAIDVDIRIPHAVLQGVYLNPNGVETITPVLPSDPNQIEIVGIGRYSAQFGQNINVVPSNIGSAEVRSMMQTTAAHVATARNNIAAQRQQYRLEQSAMSSSGITASTALQAAVARFQTVSSPSSTYSGGGGYQQMMKKIASPQQVATQDIASAANAVEATDTVVPAVQIESSQVTNRMQ